MIQFDTIAAKNNEIDFLLENIGENKVVLEVGSFEGRTTIRLAEKNKVYAVDPFIDNYDQKDIASPIVSQVKEIFKKNIDGKNIIWYEETSQLAMSHFNDKLDAVFIDGEHSKKALEIDIKWMDFVKVNGIVAFHDDSDSWPEVRDFIKENMKNHQFVGRVGSLSVFIKKF